MCFPAACASVACHTAISTALASRTSTSRPLLLQRLLGEVEAQVVVVVGRDVCTLVFSVVRSLFRDMVCIRARRVLVGVHHVVRVIDGDNILPLDAPVLSLSLLRRAATNHRRSEVPVDALVHSASSRVSARVFAFDFVIRNGATGHDARRKEFFVRGVGLRVVITAAARFRLHLGLQHNSFEFDDFLVHVHRLFRLRVFDGHQCDPRRAFEQNREVRYARRAILRASTRRRDARPEMLRRRVASNDKVHIILHADTVSNHVAAAPHRRFLCRGHKSFCGCCCTSGCCRVARHYIRDCRW